MGGPVRTCVACRRKGEKGELIKLANTPAGVVLDYLEKFPGRGAYVCVDISCITSALDERPLSRAFREKAAPPTFDGLMQSIAESAGKKVTSLLGMARKSGKVFCGYDVAVEELKKRPGGMLVMAQDVSENTKRKLGSDAPDAVPGAAYFSTRDGLGLLFGTRPVAIVYVSDHGLASALRREFGRLAIIHRG